jgi:hypothetical protein
MKRAVEWLVRSVWGDCAWEGHAAEWDVVEVNGFVRRLELECDRCGVSKTIDEPAGDPHEKHEPLLA